MRVWIGTSGYSYTDWVGGFYPPNTRPGRMLAHYARHFPLVELNFSFYRLPTGAMLARIADQAPEGFQFVVKMPRSLSHEEDPRELQPFRQALRELEGRGQLAGVLCQLPQAVHHEPKHRAWIERLAREFVGCGLAVEFRHRSWAHPEVPAWLAANHADLVSVDVPEILALYPRGLVQSGPRSYVRFHSRNASNWYRSDKDRYDYSYDDQALKEWIAAFTHPAHPSERVLLLFNNCRRSQAAENAERMRELIGRLAPMIDVVPPFATREPAVRQRSLFE